MKIKVKITGKDNTGFWIGDAIGLLIGVDGNQCYVVVDSDIVMMPLHCVEVIDDRFSN